MDTMLKLHHADLSTATLRGIRDDIAKYAHLKAYKGTFEFLGDVIKSREADERTAERERRARERLGKA